MKCLKFKTTPKRICSREISEMGTVTYWEMVNNKWELVPTNEEPHFYAARSGNVELMKVLLENNWDVKDKNKNGRTPLELAHGAGNEDVANIILEHILKTDNKI